MHITDDEMNLDAGSVEPAVSGKSAVSGPSHATRPSRSHARLADAFVANEQRAHWHDGALWFVRQKRDRMASSLPEWEKLRETAAQIKAHTLAKLPDYLEQFERQATALGAVVHWAADAQEHNQIVLRILQQNNVQRVVKSKSMLTEECHLNPFLEAQGLQVVDTDLGEWIVQLRQESPSHIVLPAIHIKKEEVGETFHEHIGTPAGNADPVFLTRAARGELRQRFIGAQAGITGVNFAIAETGGLVVCTNEGNADLGVSLPPLHIACMGIEKFIPRLNDLSVFTRLLARSATGQPITTYTSHFHGPRAGGQLHIVLVDNGRSDLQHQSNLPGVPAVHTLRRLHEHLSGVSPQWWTQLFQHGSRSHWQRLGPGHGCQETLFTALCLYAVRLLHGRVSRQDTAAPSIAGLAWRAGRTQVDSSQQTLVHEARTRGAGDPVDLSYIRLAGTHFVAHFTALANP